MCKGCLCNNCETDCYSLYGFSCSDCYQDEETVNYFTARKKKRTCNFYVQSDNMPAEYLQQEYELF